MSLPQGLDPDLLRAFAFIAEEGSFTRAAERVGRTQSAVSMQVQRLEALLGQRVLLRGKGGAVSLTPHGQYLLERAREMLAVNDEIWATFRAPQVQRHGAPRHAGRLRAALSAAGAEALRRHPSLGGGGGAVRALRGTGRTSAGGRPRPDPVHRRQRAEGLAGGRAVARPAALGHLDPPRAAPAGPAAARAGASGMCSLAQRRARRPGDRPASATASPTPRRPWRARRRRCWPASR